MEKKRGLKTNRTNNTFRNKILLIPLRYILILAILGIITFSHYERLILNPLTSYPIEFLLRFIYPDVSLISPASLVNDPLIQGTMLNQPIELISACIAVSAYILLLILNLSIRLDIKKRILSILFSFSSLLILNILRIFILILLNASQNPYFGLVHELFWLILGTISVILIWFLEVKIFNIKEIPFYTDIMNIYINIKRPKK